MSSPDAIATTTATLRHILSQIATTITTQPPGLARGQNNSSQINIFLYGTHHSAALNNMPIGGDFNKNQGLALVLKYMITVFGENDDDISAQQLMGQTMSLLHDHPLLGRSDIEGITPDSNLQDQTERVRITPDTLSLDDMSKIWSNQQNTQYRLSTAYEVSAILIESTRDQRMPLPVLKRGANDFGPHVLASSMSAITGLRFPNQKPSAELGDRLTLLGTGLRSDNTLLRLQHKQLEAPIELQLQNSSSQSELDFDLPSPLEDPNVSSLWPAGFYTLGLVQQEVDLPAQKSNLISMQLAPQIVFIDPSNTLAGDIELSIECMPQIREGQDVELVFGERSIRPDSISTSANPVPRTSLVFSIGNVVAREMPYVLRLRVDGVDSIAIDFSGETPEFSANQQVIVQ